MYDFLEEAKRTEQQSIMIKLAEVFDHHTIRNDRLAKVRDLTIFLSENPEKNSLGRIIKALRPLVSLDIPLIEDLIIATFAGTPLSIPLKKSIQGLPQPDSVSSLFNTTRDQTLQKYPALSFRSPLYYVQTPLFTWSALTSMRPASFFLGSLFPYDPKGVACNSSGLLFQEENGIDWSIGPTPTVGDEIAPETWVLLKALKQKRSELFPYNKWIYINLQNTQSPSESRRSKALLEASQKYPHEFRLASISVDTPLYRGKRKEIQTVKDHKKTLEEQLLKSIFYPSNSSCYAFSLISDEKKEWAHIVKAVLNKAYELAEDLSPAVFHELVVLGLIRAWQRFCTKNTSGKVLSTIACKECIDRGGSVNSALVWALQNHLSKQTCAQEVMSILWGRPLLSRYRLILPSRTTGFEALVKAFTPNTVRDYLSSIWNNPLGKQS